MDQYTEAAETRPTDQDQGFTYSGRPGGIVPLTVKNALLNILTLTLYRFWAKTDVRRHLWRHTLFQGDPLEYTGVGKELFLGFLLVLFVVLFPLAIVNSVFESTFGPTNAPQFLFFGFVLFLFGIAQYRARRYRLSRTVWRGVRAAQTGEAWVYGLMTLGFWFLLILTLGWSYPWQRIHLAKYEMNNTIFGDRRFKFEGTPGPLYRRFAQAWIIGLGIYLVLVWALLLIGKAIT